MTSGTNDDTERPHAAGSSVGLSVRTFQPEDRDAIVELWRRCTLTVPWNDPHKDIDRKCADGTDLFLIGESDGRLVASVMGGYEGHRGWMNYLAVDAACRGQGLGRALVVALEKRLLALGCPKLNLQVRATNAEVIAFYESLGFSDDKVMSLGKRLIADDPIADN